MVDFVRPNFLGTKQEFSNMFERPILNGQCADSTESDIRLMRFRSHVLHSLLKGFVQRRYSYTLACIQLYLSPSSFTHSTKRGIVILIMSVTVVSLLTFK